MKNDDRTTPASAAVPAVATYDSLLAAIREVRSASRKRVEQAIDLEKVREAWETGKLIDAHVLENKERAGYGERVLERLSADLGTSRTELFYMLEFFRTYSIVPSTGQLSWSHYRELLSLNNAESRKEVAREAVRQRWTEKELREEVRRRQSGSANLNTEKFPAAQPGKIYTYRIVKASQGPYRGRLGVDLGFSNYFRAEEISPFKERDLVTLESGKLEKAPSGEEQLFTYNAYVIEIIDGDTFRALVDLGFNIVTEQKLRLRALDAPRVESADGRRAKEFLEKHLPVDGTPILIKTARSDKYDRYLADVWAGEMYINQKLIDEGLAVSLNV